MPKSNKKSSKRKGVAQGKRVTNKNKASKATTKSGYKNNKLINNAVVDIQPLMKYRNKLVKAECSTTMYLFNDVRDGAVVTQLNFNKGDSLNQGLQTTSLRNIIDSNQRLKFINEQQLYKLLYNEWHLSMVEMEFNPTSNVVVNNYVFHDYIYLKLKWEEDDFTELEMTNGEPIVALRPGMSKLIRFHLPKVKDLRSNDYYDIETVDPITAVQKVQIGLLVPEIARELIPDGGLQYYIPLWKVNLRFYFNLRGPAGMSLASQANHMLVANEVDNLPNYFITNLTQTRNQRRFIRSSNHHIDKIFSDENAYSEDDE